MTALAPVRSDAPARARIRIDGLVVLGALALAAVTAWHCARHGMVDLDVYRFGDDALLRQADLYAMRSEHGLPFTYPPFAAALFALFGPMPFGFAQVVWTFAGLAALTYLVAECLTCLRSGPLRAWTPSVSAAPLLAAVLALLLEPVDATLSFGQVNLLIVALVVADFSGRLPRLPRGVLVGVAAAVKLTPLLFVVLFLAMGRRAAAACATATFAAAAAVGAVLLPSASWLFWSTHVRDSSRPGDAAYVSNQSTRGLLARLSGEITSVTVVWFAVGVLVALAGIAVAVLAARSGLPLLAVSAGGLTTCLVSPISWSHHYVWALPAAAATADLLARRRRSLPVVLGVSVGWSAVFVVAPIWRVPSSSGGVIAELAAFAAGDAYVLAATVWLALVAVLLGGGRRRRPTAGGRVGAGTVS